MADISQHRLPVRLGTLEFDLYAEHSVTHGILLDRFGGYLRVDNTPSRSVLKVAQSFKLGQIGDRNAQISIREPSFELRYEPKGISEMVSIIEAAQGYEEDPLLTGLLHYISLLAVDQNSLLVHAGAVVLEGQALVFPGKSGAGKSTLSGMFDKQAVLNDEFVLLEHGGRVVASTPFFGTSMPDRRGLWQRMKVLALLTLKHAPAPSLRSLEQRAGFRSILINTACAHAASADPILLIAEEVSRRRWVEFAFNLDAQATRQALHSAFRRTQAAKQV